MKPFRSRGALARLLRDDMMSTCGVALPSALACLQDDFEAHCPSALPTRASVCDPHDQHLERLFGEEWRRTKVIPLAFGERVVLKSFLHGFEYGPRF